MKTLKRLSEPEAVAKLVKAVEEHVKHARWVGWNSKIDQLRAPLLQLKQAQQRNLRTNETKSN